MPQENHSRLREIFSQAVELEPEHRAAFLVQACGTDEKMRQELERLLCVYQEPDPVLDVTNVGELLAPPPAKEAFSAGERVGRFEIVRLIGRGGMGEVYEAQDLHFGDRIALKTIRAEFVARPDFAARFRREIQLARKVTHPNVCRLYDVGRHGSENEQTAYLTMELLAGDTLAERIHRGVPQLSESVIIIRQVLAGLAALHLAGVVHRDLKPANILLTETNRGLRVVITDFGLAHPIESGAPEIVTAAGQILGTPAYMSPEQLSGKKLGPEGDIYSLGVVMYELLSGKPPFEANNFVDFATLKLARRPVPPSRYSPSLNARWDELVLACCDKDPRCRPSSIQDVIERFEAAVAQPPASRFHFSPSRRFARGFRALAYTVATGAVATAPLTISSWREAAFRQLCGAFPGQSTVCQLPASKDIAVFPFQSTGSGPASNAAAVGLAHYFRDSLERLYPNQDKACIHLRTDQLSDGVALVLEGQAEADERLLALHMTVREAKGAAGRAPLILRRITVRAPSKDSARLHAEALRQISRALGIRYDPREWQAWQAAGPRYADAFVNFLEGLGYVDQGDYNKAIAALNSALQPTRDFAFAPVHVALGDAYRLFYNTTGDLAYASSARHAYQRAVPLDRDFGFTHVQRNWGELEASLKDNAAAIQHYQSGLSLDPYNLRLIKSAVAAFESSGQPGRAEELLRSSAARAPRCWLAHSTLADFYSRHGRVDVAEKELLEVVRLSPDNANAFHNLAFDYIKVGRVDDAIEMASRAIALRPLPRAYSTLGRAYLYRGCSSDALTNLKRATELDTQDFVVSANLAEGLFALDPRSKLAGETYARTVELSARYLEKSPYYAYARAQNALNLARMGRTTDALAGADRAIEQGGSSNDIRLLVVQTFEAAGRRDRAISELERAFASGLPLREAEHAASLALLRRSPAYAAVLRRLRLNNAADPGGLTLSDSLTCPATSVAGSSLRRKPSPI